MDMEREQNNVLCSGFSLVLVSRRP